MSSMLPKVELGIGINNMYKFLSILFTIMLIANSTYAETIKSADQNQTMSDEEFLQRWKKLEKKKEESKQKLEASKKVGKELDELLKILKIEK